MPASAVTRRGPAPSGAEEGGDPLPGRFALPGDALGWPGRSGSDLRSADERPLFGAKPVQKDLADNRVAAGQQNAPYSLPEALVRRSLMTALGTSAFVSLIHRSTTRWISGRFSKRFGPTSSLTWMFGTRVHRLPGPGLPAVHTSMGFSHFQHAFSVAQMKMSDAGGTRFGPKAEDAGALYSCVCWTASSNAARLASSAFSWAMRRS